MDTVAIGWDRVVDAAQRSGWTTYVGTIDPDDRPHVAVVAPGFSDGTVWFATRASSKKARNLRAHPDVAFHWPVGSADAPGELAAWGTATLHDGDEARRDIWSSGVMPYDLAAFWGTPDNPELLFVEVAVRRARVQTQHAAEVWSPG